MQHKPVGKIRHMDGWKLLPFRVRANACATCIYRKDSPFNLAGLEAAISNEHGFIGHRVCHHVKKPDNMCCRGFWNRHKDAFPMGQVAQRVGAVEFVEPAAEEI